MTLHLSDRRRVECLLIVDMLAGVIVDGARDRTEPETVEAAGLLSAAARSLDADRPVSQRLKLHSRRARLTALAVRPHKRPGMPVAALGLAVYCLLRRLTDAGYFEIGAGSDLMAALDRLLPALERAMERDALSLDEAEAMSGAILRSAKEAGYFEGLQEPAHV